MSHFYTCQSGVRKHDLRKFLYEDEDSALFHWICCFSSCIIETHLCMCHKNMVKCLKENYIRSYSLLILLKHFYRHVCICCYACMYMQLLHFCLIYFYTASLQKLWWNILLWLFRQQSPVAQLSKASQSV